jgi:hypothetical protein
MPVDRQGPALRVALEHVARATPEGTQPHAYRALCDRLATWVFEGGRSKKPQQGELTEFVRATVRHAVNAGLTHAYGDTHRGEIDPGVITRLILF